MKSDLIYSFINLILRLITGPFVIYFISKFLSPVDQGFWYLFGSITAFTVLGDLGFTNIVMQFSAHEFVNLGFENDKLSGDKSNLAKYSGLFKFSIKWAIRSILIIFPIVFSVGVFFLRIDGQLFDKLLPWTIYSIGSILFFLSNVLLSFVEGMHEITFVQRQKIISNLINLLIVLPLLYQNEGLFALALGMLISSTYIFVAILYKFRFVFIQLFYNDFPCGHNWLLEFMPLFKRYAISFASGFFILQLFIPISHYYYGPIISGKVGISLALINSIFQLSNVWIYTITPKLNGLISLKNYSVALVKFNSRLLLSMLTYATLTGLFAFVYCIKYLFPEIEKILSRFLDFQSLICLFMAYFFQLIINGWATYVRSNKVEPFTKPSFILSIYVLIVFWVVGNYFSYKFIFWGFLSSYIWWLPFAKSIFNRYKIHS